MSEPPLPDIADFLRESVIRQDLIVHMRWSDGTFSRLSTAYGGLRLPADVIEQEEGAFYACAPFLLELPPFRSLVNGVSDAQGIKISDIDAAMEALTIDHSELAEGAIINVGKVFWDRDWSMLGPARWGFAGQGGEMKFDRKAGRVTAAGEVQPMQRSIELTINSQMVARAGSYRAYWTAPQHKIDHPDDEIFSQINKISVGYNKVWPRF